MMNEETIREFVKNLDYEDTQVLHKFLDEKWKRKEVYTITFDVLIDDVNEYDLDDNMSNMIKLEFTNPRYIVGEGFIEGTLNVERRV